MSTVVLVTKGAHACIAADTLTRYGDTKESAAYIANHEKIVSCAGVHMAPTGPASAQLALRSILRNQPLEPGQLTGPDAIYDWVLELQRILKADYGLNAKEDEQDPYESLQMELAICSPAGIFGVYPLRTVQQYTRYYAIGSGAPYALGALAVLYESEQGAEALARAAVEAAATFDAESEGPITSRVVTLTR